MLGRIQRIRCKFVCTTWSATRVFSLVHRAQTLEALKQRVRSIVSSDPTANYMDADQGLDDAMVALLLEVEKNRNGGSS